MSEATELVGSAAKSMPLWVKAMLAGSVLCMAAGVVIPLVSHTPPAPPAGMSAMTNSLASGGSSAAESGGAGGAAFWSPAVFKLGFSFFVGFTVAYALRSFLKFALLSFGFMFLVLFGLQYAGLIEVKWALMERQYDGVSTWLGEQTRSFTAFVSGALPSAGAATTGLVAGFRRK